VTSDEEPNLLSLVIASGGSIIFKPTAALGVEIFVSLRQNGVGTGFIGANAILPKGHCHSELFFEHYDPINIAVWSADMAGFSERFAVRRERIFAADVELFGFPFDR
jgi:hypothetical protein